MLNLAFFPHFGHFPISIASNIGLYCFERFLTAYSSILYSSLQAIRHKISDLTLYYRDILDNLNALHTKNISFPPLTSFKFYHVQESLLLSHSQRTLLKNSKRKTQLIYRIYSNYLNFSFL